MPLLDTGHSRDEAETTTSDQADVVLRGKPSVKSVSSCLMAMSITRQKRPEKTTQSRSHRMWFCVQSFSSLSYSLNKLFTQSSSSSIQLCLWDIGPSAVCGVRGPRSGIFDSISLLCLRCSVLTHRRTLLSFRTMTGKGGTNDEASDRASASWAASVVLNETSD